MLRPCNSFTSDGGWIECPVEGCKCHGTWSLEEDVAAQIPEGTDLWTERTLPIGTLWGEICVSELGGEWVKVRFEDDSGAIGVFSKDRSVGIYPWYFVLGCVENGAPVTIELAWNMLRARARPRIEQPAGRVGSNRYASRHGIQVLGRVPAGPVAASNSRAW